MHLLDERIHRLETALAAQPARERHAQGLAVQIALEVDQVGLDQETAALLQATAWQTLQEYFPALAATARN